MKCKCFWMCHFLFLIWNCQMIKVASPSLWRQTRKAPEQIQSVRAFARQFTKMLLGKHSQCILQRSSRYSTIVRIAIIILKNLLNPSKSPQISRIPEIFWLTHLTSDVWHKKSMRPWPWSSLAASATIPWDPLSRSCEAAKLGLGCLGC